MSDASEAPAGVFQSNTEREALEQANRAVATTVERVETVGEMEPATRGALYVLLSSLADNKYVLGRRYAEWCTGAPQLESAVAAAAMAQDELGHARSFYPLLRGFPEATAADTAEEAGWQNRPTSAMASLGAKFATWVDFVAANFVADTALTTLLESAVESPYEPLRQRARKIVQEEQAHWVHAEGWVRRLAEEPETLAASLRAVWDEALCWFGQADDPVFIRLGRAGLIEGHPDGLRQRLRSRLGPSLESSGLAELLERALPWDRWDAKTRRLRESR